MKTDLDLREKGGPRGGERQTSDQRLFMQLLAFRGCTATGMLVMALDHAGIEGVLYEDLNDPTGVALLTWHHEPEFFATTFRKLLGQPAFADLVLRPEYTMFGRTYSLGHEPDLTDWLLDRPRRVATDATAQWGVFYPLRRTGAFAALAEAEQVTILREHGALGHAFGEAGYAQDLRLACFGLDRNDNDFVIGLLGPALHPLSACIQAMRKTRQTSSYIAQMGPFFVGHAVWRKLVKAQWLEE